MFGTERVQLHYAIYYPASTCSLSTALALAAKSLIHTILGKRSLKEHSYCHAYIIYHNQSLVKYFQHIFT